MSPIRPPRMAALLLVTVIFPGVPLAAQRSRLEVPYTADTLPNGLILLVHEDHSTPIVTVNTLRRVGSGDEKPGRTGFAAITGRL